MSGSSRASLSFLWVPLPYAIPDRIAWMETNGHALRDASNSGHPSAHPELRGAQSEISHLRGHWRNDRRDLTIVSGLVSSRACENVRSPL